MILRVAITIVHPGTFPEWFVRVRDSVSPADVEITLLSEPFESREQAESQIPRYRAVAEAIAKALGYQLEVEP